MIADGTITAYSKDSGFDGYTPAKKTKDYAKGKTSDKMPDMPAALYSRGIYEIVLAYEGE